MDGSASATMQTTAYGYSNPGAQDIHTLTALLEPPGGSMGHGDGNLGHDGFHQNHVRTGGNHATLSQGADHSPQMQVAGAMQVPQDVGVNYGMDGVQHQQPGMSAKIVVNPPRTLPAVLAHHMRAQNKPVSEDELYAEVNKVYSELRKPDGTRYTGNLERAVRGSLCSTGMFEKLEDGNWTLREEQTQAYEERLAQRAAKQEAEKRNKRSRRAENAKAEDGGEEAAAEGGERRKRKYTRRNPTTQRLKRSEKREAILNMLSNFSENLKKDASWASCYQNPFKNFKGDEQADDVWKKFGNEKFVFMLQMFSYLTDLIQHRELIREQLAKEKQKSKENAKNANSDKRIEQSVPEQLTSLNSSLGNLEEAIQKLTGRLGNVEQLVGGQQPVWPRPDV